LNVGLPLGGQFSIASKSQELNYLDGLSNELRIGPSFKVQLSINYSLSKTFSISASPFLETLSFERSYIATVPFMSNHGQPNSWIVNEPASKTFQLGTSINFAFLI
jgi:hypothetical protein